MKKRSKKLLNVLAVVQSILGVGQQVRQSMLARIALGATLVILVLARASGQIPAQSYKSCPKIKIIVEQGRVVWNGAPVRDRVALEGKLLEASEMKPKPCFTMGVSRDGFAELLQVIKLMQKYHFRAAFLTKQPNS